MSQWLYNCNGLPATRWETSTPPFVLHTIPGRTNSVRARLVPNLDLNLQRDFAIHESWRLELRGEALNLTTSVLFPGPDTNPFDGAPRQANGSWIGFGTIAPFQYNFLRIVKIALKLYV